MENITQYAELLDGKLRDLIGPAIHDYVQDKVVSFVKERSNKFWAGAAVIPITYCAFQFITRPGKVRVKRPDNKYVRDGEPEIIIIGCGIMGAALSAVLGKEGRKLTVIERDMSEPDRIVGEFLQPGGVRALKVLGLEDCLNDIDSRPFHGYVFHDVTFTKTRTQMPFPPENVSGQGFHHGRFLQQLRKESKSHKSVTVIEGVVTDIIYEDNVCVGVRYRDKGQEEVKRMDAPLVVVADGIYSRFRKDLIKTKPVPSGHFCGVMMHHCPQSIEKHLEVVLSEPSFILTYQVSTTCTRALVDVPTNYRELPKDMSEYLTNEVQPKLPDHMKASFLDAIVNKRFTTLPLNFLPANPKEVPGLMLLGDSLNVRHALTGGGMTVSFNDIIHIRNALRKVSDLYEYSAVMTGYRRFLYERKSTHAFTVNVAAFVLYHIFASPDPHVRMLKQGLHEYFNCADWANRGGIGILSILQPSPFHLLKHLWLSMVYSVFWQLTHDIIVPRSLYNSAAILVKGTNIMRPFIVGELRTYF